MTYQQFPSISLDTVISDPTYPLEELTITIDYQGVLSYAFDTVARIISVFKPTSFWLGSDSLLLKAVNPEGGADSSWLIYRSTPTTICKGKTIILAVVDPPAGATFLWSATPPDPSLVEPTSPNPSVTPQQTTFYQVNVSAPGQSYTDSLTVVVYQSEPAILSGPLPAYCVNASPVQLYGTTAGGSFTGNGVAGSLFYPTAAGVGQTTIHYSVITPDGCESTDSLVVTIHPIPQLFLPPDSTICHWQTIILDAGLGYDTYLWSTGDITSFTTVNATGMLSDSTRHITLIVTKNGCPGFDTSIVHFKACTGIDSRMPDGGCLQVYPNPVSSVMTLVNGCSSNPMDCKLLDLLGNEMTSLLIQPGINTLGTDAILPGMYILIVQGEEIFLVIRVVKVY